ncbi:hypothetical protein I568_01189 [Enterococcus columbae DSM 7374 = ATCC 51263]|uniref:Transposase n=1 Tax=Enterococcus columbae DSM 7374 = ATCC 51263 TaxID=1121865 RepID=S0KU64_9ENTE|nr:hypothetical protein OMW_00591 [Enterococcus columbae DSM 7374 = ATCC 51263]EOW84693.1 hypothetical protein I568_01189 [Enterococcus columbae DSM 7374 = ATCC 51263]
MLKFSTKKKAKKAVCISVGHYIKQVKSDI